MNNMILKDLNYITKYYGLTEFKVYDSFSNNNFSLWNYTPHIAFINLGYYGKTLGWYAFNRFDFLNKKQKVYCLVDALHYIIKDGIITTTNET